MALVPAISGKTVLNTPRLRERRKALRQAFSVDAMEFAWTRYVRDGLRNQEILDLYDFNDFHWDRRAYFESLRSEILSGNYVPSAAVPVRVEKANGVNRTLIIPCPQDCVVLQCIVEHVISRVLKKQPSKNAFFSRSHGYAGGKVSFDADYIWFRRWRKYSKLRLSISTSHTHVLITDIANYFDNIEYGHLRNIMSSVARIDEVILDVMFRVLDAVSWRPDYLPPPGKSLPQVHFDAPRLLAHAYLYEVDEHLKVLTNDKFARWVDDITVPANSYEEAKGAARDLDQLLLTRGLRLNAGKTKVMNAKQASDYFFRAENDYLDQEQKKIEKFAKMPKRMAILQSRLRKNALAFLSKPKPGQWDKVAKRYIGLFDKIRDDSLSTYCAAAIENEPRLRDSIWRYYESLGPSSYRFEVTSKYVLGDHALDDASIFQACDMLVKWPVKPGSSLHMKLRSLGMSLGNIDLIAKSHFYFTAGLRLVVKYGLVKHLADYRSVTEDIWQVSEFMSRDVAATLPKLRTSPYRNKARRIIESHKHASAISVIASQERITREMPILRFEVRQYILNGKNKSNYTIDRFLLALHVIINKDYPEAQRKVLKSELLIYIQDPLFLRVIKAIKV